MPILVGGPCKSPFLAGIQSVDRGASIVDQRDRRHLDAVDSPGFPGFSAHHDPGAAGIQPLLSVLDPHRGGSAHAGVVRIFVQHTLAPSRSSRLQPPLPGPQLRRGVDGMGSSVRHFRRGTRRGAAGRSRVRRGREVEQIRARRARRPSVVAAIRAATARGSLLAWNGKCSRRRQAAHSIGWPIFARRPRRDEHQGFWATIRRPRPLGSRWRSSKSRT